MVGRRHPPDGWSVERIEPPHHTRLTLQDSHLGPRHQELGNFLPGVFHPLVHLSLCHALRYGIPLDCGFFILPRSQGERAAAQDDPEASIMISEVQLY